MLGISVVKINSFLSYVFPALEFVNFFGDRRVKFLVKKIRVALKICRYLRDYPN